MGGKVVVALAPPPAQPRGDRRQPSSPRAALGTEGKNGLVCDLLAGLRAPKRRASRSPDSQIRPEASIVYVSGQDNRFKVRKEKKTCQQVILAKTVL